MSVVPYGFDFEQFQDRFSEPIINEVGTRDIWPAIAESVTFGYGSAETYGFRRPLVRDRWHNGAGHGYFLDAEFCRKFWVPFLRDGQIAPASKKPESPRAWLQLLSIFKIKHVSAALLAVVLASVFHLPSKLSEAACRTAPIEQAQHRIPYETWLHADAKTTLAARAFAIQVSLASIASRTLTDDTNRQLSAIRSGALTKKFFPVYVCTFSKPADCPTSWTAAIADYSRALFSFSREVLPTDEVVRLFGAVKGTEDNLVQLLDALVSLGESSSDANTTRTLARDAMDFEVKIWLATPAIDDRPSSERVTDIRIAALKTVSASAGADQRGVLAAIDELRKAGLKPLASSNMLADLAHQLDFNCNLISREPASLAACKSPLNFAASSQATNPR